FKENCPDTRNSKVFDIVNELEEYGITPVITDPVADREEAKRIYGIEFSRLDKVQNMDAVIIAVAHDEFKMMTKEQIDCLYGLGKKVLLDIKGVLDRDEYENAGYSYWRL
ncbi:MAG: nucleotide sugar dehydrogenase, partial [Clostridia bacterium]|nr:nucleotide sugar dehydrogenase [Clostridia bacterium]